MIKLTKILYYGGIYMEKQKHSVLSILGLIFSISGCLGILGFIFNIVSVADSRNKRKGISYVGFVFNAIWVVILLIFLIGGSDSGVSDESKSMSEQDFKNACVTVDYKELFRNSDDYLDKKVKFTGQIQQVVTDSDSTGKYLISVTYSDGFWDDNIYVVLDRTNTDTKFLEDDVVTFYGEASGTYTYTNAFDVGIEVPQINALYMDIEK